MNDVIQFLMESKKVYLKEQLSFDFYHLTIGKCYVAHPTPVIYDPITLQPVEPSYVVRCDDGLMRKVDAKYFMTLEEWREMKLNEIGI